MPVAENFKTEYIGVVDDALSNDHSEAKVVKAGNEIITAMQR